MRVLLLLALLAVGCVDTAPTKGWTATDIGFRGVVTLRHDLSGTCFVLYNDNYAGGLIIAPAEVCQ